jgi:hypothetical protein
MAEPKVEKPSASPTRSREELMALLSKNPNVNPQTGAPAPATPKGLPVAAPEESFLDVVERKAGAPVAPTRSPKLLDTSTPAKQAEMERFIRDAPVVDNPRASTPIGNITGLDNSVSTNPYRVSAAGEDEITGANFSAGISPVGNALKNSPVVDNPRASTPIGNITGLDNSVSTNPSPRLGEGSVSSTSQRTPAEQKVADIYGFDVPLAAPKAIPVAEPVDTDRAAMLFAKTHGSAFDPKSSMDKKKMAAIINLMGQEGSEALTPNQFALKIYRTTKK